MRRLLALPLALACLVAGCGAERAAGPGGELPRVVNLRTLRFPAEGMRVSVPVVTDVDRRPAPAVFRAGFGDWFVSAFAYRRREQIPRRRRELREARNRLVRAVRRRDRSFRVLSTRTARAGGAPAVELVGDQVLSKSRLRTRSLHVYKGSAEYVLEMVAPVGRYATLDGVFDRVAASLRVTGRVRPRKKR